MINNRGGAGEGIQLLLFRDRKHHEIQRGRDSDRKYFWTQDHLQLSELGTIYGCVIHENVRVCPPQKGSFFDVYSQICHRDLTYSRSIQEVML